MLEIIFKPSYDNSTTPSTDILLFFWNSYFSMMLSILTSNLYYKTTSFRLDLIEMYRSDDIDKCIDFLSVNGLFAFCIDQITVAISRQNQYFDCPHN